MTSISPEAYPTLNVFLGNRGHERRPIAELLYMQSDASYTWLIWRTGERLLMPRTLKYFEAFMPTGRFIRLHRQCAVNTDHIEQVEQITNQLVVRLTSGVRLPVSRRRTPVVRLQLQRYMSLNDRLR